MSGGFRTMAARADGVVSPVRTAVLMARAFSPAAAAMPASGAERLRSISLFSALSGET